MNLDQRIGSILEAWVNRDTGEGCRFCNEPVGDVPAMEKFCSEECEDRFETVMDARIAIGKRDLQQRGYD
jgi:hypothetical protein